MAGLYWEDFQVGQVFDHPWGRTITESDNSLLTLGLMIGMTVNDTTLDTTIANLGMSDVRFPKPLLHGDTIRVRSTVRSLRESKSRPSAGIVEFEHVASNQHGQVVAICVRQALMHKRTAKLH